jgi:uncharacterized membrane protein YhaH (DUF805 family)
VAQYPLVRLLTSFQGRTRRSHYWLACIGLSVFAIAAEIAVRLAFPQYPTSLQMLQHPALMLDDSPAYRIPRMLLLLITGPVTYMQAAVIAKRWHDRGKSGWFTLLSYVPLVCLWPFVELGFFDGTRGTNRFGPSPKGVEAEADVFS